MKIHVKNSGFIILLMSLMGFCGKSEGVTVTCEPQYGFLPCTSETWGTLFLIVVYQYVIALAQKYVSKGSDMFFGLVGPGIFGASLFHILANFPTLYLVLQTGLSNDVEDASSSTEIGMSILTGSTVMNLTLIWPSVITFGSYNFTYDDEENDEPQLPEDEPSFVTKLSAYGVTTDIETNYTARIMLISSIPFVLLQLPAIITSTSVTRVIILVTLILVVSLFFIYMLYQMFQPWIQNRTVEYVTQKFVKSKLEALLSRDGRPNVRLIKEIYDGLDVNNDGQVSKSELKTLILGIQLQEQGEISDDLVEKVMEQFDISGDDFIQLNEFIRIMTKWLRDTRKSLAQNGTYKPLISFFIKHNRDANADADEEQQMALIPKQTPNNMSSILEFLEALCLVLFGTVVTMVIGKPLTSNLVTFASNANVPSFFIPYFIVPCFSNISRLLATINSARQKTERAASLTLSQIYSGVAMSSLSSLTTFLSVVYIRDLPWDVSAQVLVVFIICGGMSIFTSTRTVYPLWTGYMIYLMYPVSLLALYMLIVVCGW
ncbi:sodium/calcium exchanger NCL2-like [Rutidosis leptorrhynchoides]|uniref:sodium/calcium exchanger NCL2-like n=1 Tax=Rutidosis leptorrhynchoides TaxID=125765 RepID=UPI003A997909